MMDKIEKYKLIDYTDIPTDIIMQNYFENLINQD